MTTRPLTLSGAYSTLRSAQKPAYGAPAYSRWVNRPLGRFCAALAYRLGMTPNQVTGVSALVTYSGIAVLAFVRPTWTTSLLVALLLLLGYALDSADGQLARLTGLGSPAGEWLDHVIDMGKVCLLHGAVAISWVRWGVPGLSLAEEHRWWAVGVPLLFLAVTVVSFFGWLLADLLVRLARAASGTQAARPSNAPAPALRSLLRLPSDYGLLALSFAVFASAAFAPGYTILLAANSLILVAALPTWSNQVKTSQGAA